MRWRFRRWIFFLLVTISLTVVYQTYVPTNTLSQSDFQVNIQYQLFSHHESVFFYR